MHSLGGNLADVLGALDPDAVGGEEFFVLVNLGRNELEELLHLALEAS